MPSLRLWNREELPVGKIIGVGRNFARHAREMGASVPEVPVFFLKPATSYLPDGGTILLPEGVGRVDHEVELAVVMGRTARRIPEARWKDFVLGYGVCLDLTARDVQEASKKRGEPWALSKGYDTFFPMSTVVDGTRVPDAHKLELELQVNSQIRQHGSTSDWTFRLPQLLNYLSSVMTLERGDVIATGTPEGVGPIKRGDVLVARVPGLVNLTVRVDAAPRGP